jgi:hypothetical protein
LTDARSLADDAVHHLDRLSAIILDDVGDGPAPADFASQAAEVHRSVLAIGVGAFSELTGLIVGVGSSMTAGATDWSPSLGGTLMAAVDDLRALVMRAAQFSAEDGEHLHHRAAELATFVRVTSRTTSAQPAPPVPSPMPEIPTPAPAAPSAPSVAVTEQPINRMTDEPSVVPISSLFFAEGPTVVSGGVPTSASAASDVLGAAIDALDAVGIRALAEPLASATRVVPVEQLIYRGRAALERAAALREQIKTSGAAASPTTLDEMYDLIGLALND